MPHCCVAYRCNSIQGKDDDFISFHRFPKKLKERNKWAIAVRRKDWKPSNSSRLCSVHFKDEDYIQGLQRRVLSPGAIPSIFPSFPSHLQRKEKKRRILVRAPFQEPILQSQETESEKECSSSSLAKPNSCDLPSKSIEIEHNYSYPDDINFLKNRCDMLKESLEKMAYQNKLLKEKLIRRDSKITKLDSSLQDLHEKRVLSNEAIYRREQYHHKRNNIQNKNIK